MAPVTTTIRKSVAGLFLIWIVGLTVAAVFIGAAVMNYRLGGPLWRIYSIVALLTVLITALSAYVYRLSYIHLDEDGITVVAYSALFTDRHSETLYRDIEDVQILQPGILSAVLGYNTLMVETAGTIPNLKLTFVPNGHRWAAYLISQARQARVPVST